MKYKYRIPYENKLLDVYRLPYEPLDSNMFFIPIGESGVVFDPNENDVILQLFEKYKTSRIKIVLTHEHYDHISGVQWLQSKIESILICQKACAEAIAIENNNKPRLISFVLASRDAEDGGHRYQDFKDTFCSFSLHADLTYEKEFVFEVEDAKVYCYSTPGHSPGSAIYLFGNNYVFTGDSLIQDAPAIVKFPKSNEVLYEIITRPFLKSLDKNIMVFPGHGEPFKIYESKYP